LVKRPEWANLRLFLLPLVVGAALLALPASSSAAEIESGSIAGVVTEAGGEPVVEAEVCAEAIDKSHFKCITTGTDGTYEITGLGPGVYKVGFWTTRNYVVQFWGKALTWGTATPVIVLPATTTPEIDATLEVGATISGTVTAEATLLPVGEVEACATLGEIERCATTNASGQYTIDGLVAGRWNVYFYAQLAEADVVSAPYSRAAVEVGPQQNLTGVSEALIPGGQIAGTVSSATTGAPLGGVQVCVTAASSPTPLGCLRTPASGVYRFMRIWPGQFKVVFSPKPTGLEGPDSYPTQWWGGQPTFATATVIEVTPPAIVSDIDASFATPLPPAPTVSVSVAKKPILRCKRGFLKRKVHGKQRCVKRQVKPKKHRSHHKPTGHAPRPRATRP
jgi:hypothetical protein